MQLSTLLLVVTAFIFLFSFAIRNINYAVDILDIDITKLKQSVSYLQERNKKLTNSDLANLELH